MNDFDIPIFKKTYELYKIFYSFRNNVSKQDRYTLWQRCEDIMLDILENLLLASQLSKSEKLPILEKTSVKLNLLRIVLRLCKEVKVIDGKKYVEWQETLDEIGRIRDAATPMLLLGGSFQLLTFSLSSSKLPTLTWLPFDVTHALFAHPRPYTREIEGYCRIRLISSLSCILFESR